MTQQPPIPLATRWLRDAAEDPSTDLQVLEVVDRCRTGSSVNESGLLRDLVAHADAIVEGVAAIPGSVGDGRA